MKINELANLIRSKKQQHKSVQRKYSRLIIDGTINKNTWRAEPEKYHFVAEPLFKEMNSTRREIYSLICEFRISHILASLVRCKTIGQIEPKKTHQKL